MAALSQYLEQALLDHVLRNTAYTSPSTVYLALYESDPLSGGTEVSGGSYARQSVSFDAPSASGDQSTVANSADVTFSDMPSTTVTHVGILDASSSGNLLLGGALTSSRTVSSGDPVTVLAGELVVGLE
jgi:hypothetical protein